MTLPQWREAPISRTHDRAGFDCGDAALNEFLHRFARQSHEQGAAKTFVAADDALPQRVLGFYSLAPATLSYARTPAALKKGLAQHEVPGFRLARLAVDRRIQGSGLGTMLLLAAGRRCLRVAAEVGGVMLLIDAKTEAAARWYETSGAIRLVDAPLSLILPLATVRQALDIG